MKDQSKTKQSLIQELASLREKITELEKSEAARKKMEETLRESEEKFKVLANSTPAAVMLYQDDRWIYANRAAETICGYSEKELLAMNFWDIVHPDFKLFVQERGRLHQQGKRTIISYEFKIIAKDGSEKWVDLSGASTMLQGRPAGIITVLDITDRKRIEEELKENEKKYRLLADNAKDVIFVLDMNLNYTYVSPSVKILRGYDPEEVLKQSSIDQSLTPSSMDLAMKALSEVMELEKIEKKEDIFQTLQLEVIRKDGTTVWTETKVSFIRDKDQQPVGILGVSRDITERKQAVDALLEREERYRLIIENTADTIAVFDLNLNITTYVSPLIRKLRGYTVQEAMTQTLNQMLTPDSFQRLSKLFAEQLELESSGTADPARTVLIELEENCKDGSTIWVEVAASFLRDNDFKPNGILTLTRNITDRKQAEERLKETLDRLRKALGTTIQVLVSAVESRDSYTAGHQSRSANLACAIATEMALSQEKIEGIRMAGIIHDIGKLSIPAEILSKPTKLKEIEFSLIKQHSRSGCEILKNVESPWPLAEIVHQHHERMDGSGYPRNLNGDEILIESRILAVADVVEAMASHRPYRPALGIDAALEEIEKNRGILYDNTVVDACLRLFREKGYQLT